MYKRVATGPEWLEVGVLDLYSVSGCISKNFVEYIDYWRHNGYWLFDSPDVMEEIAAAEGVDLAGMTLFYYEAYEHEFDDESNQWLPFDLERSFVTNVSVPTEKHLAGFDVATFSMGGPPECSPLSCNALAEEIPVNEHCLFDTFDEAKTALDSGLFRNTEPGPHRIFAVYAITRDA